MKIKDYTPLNLTALLEAGDCAVQCCTEDEALHFLATMKQLYPAKCKTWTFPDVYWNHSREDGYAYAPYFNKDRSMKHARVGYYSDLGFRIFQYWELTNNDIDEISTQDLSGIVGVV